MVVIRVVYSFLFVHLWFCLCGFSFLYMLLFDSNMSKYLSRTYYSDSNTADGGFCKINDEIMDKNVAVRYVRS